MPSDELIRIRFSPGDLEDRVPVGTMILGAALRLGAPLASDCGGRGTCGKCQVLIHGLDGVGPGEESAAPLPGRRCLACQTPLERPCSIEIVQPLPIDEVTLEAGTNRPLVSPAPAVRRLVLEAASPKAFGVGREPDQALDFIQRLPGLENLGMDAEALRQAITGLTPKARRLGLTLAGPQEVIWLAAAPSRILAGLAVDLGTTTITASLCDLQQGTVLCRATTLNPQVTWGADVVSRISHYAQAPERNGAVLQGLAVQAINRLIAKLCQAGHVESHDIMEMALVGNPTMHHLFLGLDPLCLAMPPYQPYTSEAMRMKARDLGVAINPGAYLEALPLIGGQVGSDTVAAMLSQGTGDGEESVLLVDMGTNGELVLQKGGRKVCCSCATGPAFEGGCIHQGSRAIPGALCRARMDDGGQGLAYQVVGQSIWYRAGQGGASGVRGICGTGIVELVAALRGAGVITPSGAFADDRQSPNLRRGASGQREFVVVPAAETAMGVELLLTQQDVRQFQLAKGALCAGYRILMDHLGVTRLGRVDLAGIFGSKLDPTQALTAGILPPVAPQQVRSIGDAAGQGAAMALLNVGTRQHAAHLARETEHLELNSCRDFQDVFIDEMAFV